MNDLETLDRRAREFVERGQSRTRACNVSVVCSGAAAEVRFRQLGHSDPLSEERLQLPQLQELSELVRQRFGTDGSVQLELAYVWSAKYGPCHFYGGSAPKLQESGLRKSRFV